MGIPDACTKFFIGLELNVLTDGTFCTIYVLAWATYIKCKKHRHTQTHPIWFFWLYGEYPETKVRLRKRTAQPPGAIMTSVNLWLYFSIACSPCFLKGDFMQDRQWKRTNSQKRKFCSGIFNVMYRCTACLRIKTYYFLCRVLLNRQLSAIVNNKNPFRISSSKIGLSRIAFRTKLKSRSSTIFEITYYIWIF